MATYNFRATEDDRPGGGVYKIPGSGPTWTIKQSDYPNVNLASMSEKNFFIATTCHTGNYAAVYTSEWQNVGTNYYGGSAGSLRYSYSGGVATISVVGASARSGRVYKYLEDNPGESYSSGGYSYRLYMSRTPIM